MATATPSQSAIVQELYSRIDTLPPDKQLIVRELASRFGSAPAAKAPAALGKIEGMMSAEPEQAVSNAPDKGLIPYPVHRAIGNVIQGVEQMAEGTGQDIAGGASKVFRGGGTLAAPSLALPAMTSPVATVGGMAGAGIAATGASAALRGVDIPQGYKDAAEDAAGVAGGGLAGLTAEKLMPIVQAVMAHPAVRNAALELVPKGRAAAVLLKVVGDVIKANGATSPSVAATNPQTQDFFNRSQGSYRPPPTETLTPPANASPASIQSKIAESRAAQTSLPDTLPGNRSKQAIIETGIKTAAASQEGVGAGMTSQEFENRAWVADRAVQIAKKDGVFKDVTEFDSPEGQAKLQKIAGAEVSRNKAGNYKQFSPTTVEGIRARLFPEASGDPIKPASDKDVDYSEALQASIARLRKK